jgi:hypothetical protein
MKPMEILGKILGSPARVKIMRLFLLNRTKTFASKDIFDRSRVSPEAGRKELRLLAATGFIKKKGDNWIFNPTFRYVDEISNLLINGETIDSDGVLSMFKHVGKLKLVLVSGIFIKNKDTRVDILIVGDKIKRSKVDDTIRKLEAEIGSELSYAVFETPEFLYRISMYDKLVRDILDFPHKVVLQAKELSTTALKTS